MAQHVVDAAIAQGGLQFAGGGVALAVEGQRGADALDDGRGIDALLDAVLRRSTACQMYSMPCR